MAAKKCDIKKYGEDLCTVIERHPWTRALIDEILKEEAQEFTDPVAQTKALVGLMTTVEKLEGLAISQRKLQLREKELNASTEGAENLVLRIKELAAKSEVK